MVVFGAPRSKLLGTLQIAASMSEVVVFGVPSSLLLGTLQIAASFEIPSSLLLGSGWAKICSSFPVACYWQLQTLDHVKREETSKPRGNRDSDTLSPYAHFNEGG